MAYTKKTWEDLPSTNTPVNATDMNDLEIRIENGINNALETTTRLTDCDDATTAGVYQYVSTTTNIPPIFAYGNIIVSKTLLGGNNYITQLAIGNDGTAATRGKVNNNAWNAWKSLMSVKIASSNITASIGSLALNNSYVMPNSFVSLNLKFTGVSVSTTDSTTLATLSSGYYGTQEIGLIALVNDGTFTNCWLRNTGEIIIQPLRTFSNKEVRIIGNYSI